MISILSSPKPFAGEFADIQRRAIQSWKRLHPKVEIVLYGNSEGTSETAQTFGLRHLPLLSCSTSGVPYFNTIAEHAEQTCTYSLQVYLNADILLPPFFCEVLRSIAPERYLMVGQRIDLTQDAHFDPLTSDWKGELRQLAATGKASLHPPAGSDYFVFMRGTWAGLPPLVIGRGAYDNALIAHCLRSRVPVIDGTRLQLVIHPWHSYSHVRGGRCEAHLGPDALANRRLHLITHGAPTLEDCDYALTLEGAVKPNSRRSTLRRIEATLRFRRKWSWLGYGFRLSWRLLEKVQGCSGKTTRLPELLG